MLIFDANNNIFLMKIRGKHYEIKKDEKLGYYYEKNDIYILKPKEVERLERLQNICGSI